jgi:hypothetical protein
MFSNQYTVYVLARSSGSEGHAGRCDWVSIGLWTSSALYLARLDQSIKRYPNGRPTRLGWRGLYRVLRQLRRSDAIVSRGVRMGLVKIRLRI